MDSSLIVSQVRDRMLDSCTLLDAEMFDAWLDLWTAPTVYEISTFTPELQRDEILLRLEGEDLGTLLRGAKSQVRDGSSMSRICSPACVTVGVNGEGTVGATQTVAIYSTSIAGASQLYAIARYEDCWSVQPVAGMKLSTRKVVLTTREFSIGTHVVL